MEEKIKKKPPAALFWENKTPEERAAFIAMRSERIKAGKLKKREEEQKKKEMALARAAAREQKFGSPKEELAIRQIKEELVKMADKAYQPEWDSINRAINLCKEGRDLDAIREEFFPKISQDIWIRFKKIMFATQVSSPEDLGNELMIMRDQITVEIRREIAKMRDQQKERPLLYHQQIIRGLSSIQALHSDVAKRLVDIGAVGSKRQGGMAIQIVNYIPRPDRPLAHTKTQSQYVVQAPKQISAKGVEDIEVLTVEDKKVEA